MADDQTQSFHPKNTCPVSVWDKFQPAICCQCSAQPDTSSCWECLSLQKQSPEENSLYVASSAFHRSRLDAVRQASSRWPNSVPTYPALLVYWNDPNDLEISGLGILISQAVEHELCENLLWICNASVSTGVNTNNGTDFYGNKTMVALQSTYFMLPISNM